MFICNINFKSIKKIALVLFIFIIIISLIISLYSFIKSKYRSTFDCTKHTEFAEISSDNYTSILKLSHEDINSYIGQKIKFTGFVYRLYDFTDSQFVLAREMIIATDSTSNQAQSVVVGFLCDYKSASDFPDNTWIEVEATIQKGYYHSEIPILKISNIKSVQCPDNPYVYPPDDSYVKTENL